MGKNRNSENTTITIDGTSILVCIAILALIGFMVFLFKGGSASADSNAGTGGVSDVVSTVDGKQVIEVTVQGGYSPERIVAKADVPTIIRMKSDGAFGCERAFSIPSLKIRKSLPQDGTTDIEIAAQKAGTRLVGSCSMGMYRFTINFN